MSKRVTWSEKFGTWIVEVNLSTFAFESKEAATQFLDDVENSREVMFVDEELEPGIGHDETHSKNCQADSFPCKCSNNCNKSSE